MAKQILGKMTIRPSESQAYDKYFVFEKDKNKPFTFKRNAERINETISILGYFLILTTDFKLTSTEAFAYFKF